MDDEQSHVVCRRSSVVRHAIFILGGVQSLMVTALKITRLEHYNEFGMERIAARASFLSPFVVVLRRSTLHFDSQPPPCYNPLP